MTRFNHHWPRVKAWSLRLVEYGLVQAGVQVFTALAGLMIVRSLPKPEYALYAVAFSMQTACNSLSDLGIGIGVRSIGGRVWHDPARFGSLLNTALGLRRQFATLALSFCLPIAGWMLWRNSAHWPEVIGLCLVIAASVLPLLGITAWITSAQLHGEYRRMQKLDFSNALLRCALVGLLALTRINAILAALVGTAGNWIQLIFLRRWAREKIVTEAPANVADRREMIRLSLKALPNTIFYSFQGQVTLFILTLFGNTTGIADITALARIAVLFTILSVTFANVLSPRFARCQDPARLPRLYLMLVGGMALVLGILVTVALLFPDPFLWLLGAKYANLGGELKWVVGAACVGQVCGIMWNLNSSKACIDFQSLGYIPLTITIQVCAAFVLDLHQFHDVLIFNLLSVSASLPLFALDAIFGLKNSKKRT